MLSANQGYRGILVATLSASTFAISGVESSIQVVASHSRELATHPENDPKP